MAARWIALGVLCVLGCSTAPQPGPVIELSQLMEWVIDPAADVVWDSVKTIATEEGTKEIAPRTQEEWDAVRNAAAVLAEAGSSLMSEGRARGVLFNDSIFEGRGLSHAETWIFGGALDADVVNLTDEEFAQLIASERKRFYGVRNEPLAVHVTRWPNALPHYTIELEKILTTLPAPPPNVTLVGNYLGRIGLAKLVERAAIVAEECQNRLR